MLYDFGAIGVGWSPRNDGKHSSSYVAGEARAHIPGATPETPSTTIEINVFSAAPTLLVLCRSLVTGDTNGKHSCSYAADKTYAHIPGITPATAATTMQLVNSKWSMSEKKHMIMFEADFILLLNINL